MNLDDYQAIKFERRGRVLNITFNLPDQLNAVSERLHTEISTLFYDVQLDPDSDILVLTGAGRAFSAGGDFEQMKKANAGETGNATVFEAKKMIFGLLDLEKPIVAKVNGDAMGLGATLALFCDVIFAAEHARIADPHVSVGIVAGDGGAIIWPQLIGYARAKHYLMTGDMIDGKEAEKMGLVNFAMPLEELDQAVDAYADKLAAGAQEAIRWTKVSANIGLKQLAHCIMDVGLGYEMMSIRSPDHAEGIAAFEERRKPKFGAQK
jgi:enoyl-CoA hydratase